MSKEDYQVTSYYLIRYTVMPGIESALVLERQPPEESTSSEETVIRIITKALEMRDIETKGHTQRVRQKTFDLGKLAGFNTENLDYMLRGALIHDTGKLGIRDGVLLKQGILDERERMEMERHVEIGLELVSPIPYFRPALEILKFHHEKWNGTGYPYRIKGGEIPLAARIFSIVDVWDAVTHKRVYKEAWPREKALCYIQSESGKHFDPQVVELFLNLEKQKSL